MHLVSAIPPQGPSAEDGSGSFVCKAIAVDYDGTIAEQGRVSAVTEATLRALRDAGFRLILVSGRRLENIRRACDVLDLFEAVILENGAVSFRPRTGTEDMLAPTVDERFLADLKRELPGGSLFVGRSMVAADAGHAGRIEMVIARGGYDLHITACGERVLVLPVGIDKGSGLSHALAALGLHHCDVAAVGDEANDIALLEGCGLKAAVGNAAPELKAAADIVLPGNASEGFRNLADRLLADHRSLG
ncbi:haloacid dehalogenase [Pleomorphomonas diazotrophica]|uniref:Haloacid dehalogenase n=1 Tax=Pleomorphomonas diazotrophica TaxID=1166257 RepID=A0A1I4U651_9HYPH|nr:HAD family hydrolase [Pleomorphomonas diazotrophica]PKR91184.1 haloacid dehalogenase [Pleomorphomonas diazotrophica]SFM84478.1 hypothetical protein SAMN05192571_10746 [Pleomorphomonas diazotrophica]